MAGQAGHAEGPGRIPGPSEPPDPSGLGQGVQREVAERVGADIAGHLGGIDFVEGQIIGELWTTVFAVVVLPGQVARS